MKKLRIFQKNKKAKRRKCTTFVIQKKVSGNLHFSDGINGEYSSDDELYTSAEAKRRLCPSKLRWGPWLWYVIASVTGLLLKFAINWVNIRLARLRVRCSKVPIRDR
jgi:hypothetical protein